jgi:hypothetical protein
MIKGLGLLVLKGGGNGRGSIFSQQGKPVKQMGKCKRSPKEEAH